MVIQVLIYVSVSVVSVVSMSLLKGHGKKILFLCFLVRYDKSDTKNRDFTIHGAVTPR